MTTPTTIQSNVEWQTMATGFYALVEDLYDLKPYEALGRPLMLTKPDAGQGWAEDSASRLLFALQDFKADSTDPKNWSKLPKFGFLARLRLAMKRGSISFLRSGHLKKVLTRVYSQTQAAIQLATPVYTVDDDVDADGTDVRPPLPGIGNTVEQDAAATAEPEAIIAPEAQALPVQNAVTRDESTGTLVLDAPEGHGAAAVEAMLAHADISDAAVASVAADKTARKTQRRAVKALSLQLKDSGLVDEAALENEPTGLSEPVRLLNARAATLEMALRVDVERLQEGTAQKQAVIAGLFEKLHGVDLDGHFEAQAKSYMAQRVQYELQRFMVVLYRAEMGQTQNAKDMELFLQMQAEKQDARWVEMRSLDFDRTAGQLFDQQRDLMVQTRALDNMLAFLISVNERLQGAPETLSFLQSARGVKNKVQVLEEAAEDLDAQRNRFLDMTDADEVECADLKRRVDECRRARDPEGYERLDAEGARQGRMLSDKLTAARARDNEAGAAEHLAAERAKLQAELESPFDPSDVVYVPPAAS